MKIGKIHSVVLAEALKSKRFFTLSCYLGNFPREGSCFISEWNDTHNMWDIRVALHDYCTNERESEELFRFAKELTGEDKIVFTLVSSTVL